MSASGVSCWRNGGHARVDVIVGLVVLYFVVLPIGLLESLRLHRSFLKAARKSPLSIKRRDICSQVSTRNTATLNIPIGSSKRPDSCAAELAVTATAKIAARVSNILV